MRKGMYALQSLATILVFMFVLSGCALLQTPMDVETGEPMTSQQIAVVAAEELNKRYVQLHLQVKDILTIATEEEKAWLYENVTPKMDAVKRVIGTYTTLVMVWVETGEEPENIAEKEQRIRSAITTILFLLVRR